ncbi:hypothetical protein PHET_00797 [Paragonimus heterotremus]|uniref:C2H2-type domain-containing protein n=1 Tax=Paragonimus heterotremus TaxID=100268 RepID=A0A8J4WLV0_9TREM|nr:hypothetical protein PHET_00797 [Paragonimus heterotremus]
MVSPAGRTLYVYNQTDHGVYSQSTEIWHSHSHATFEEINHDGEEKPHFADSRTSPDTHSDLYSYMVSSERTNMFKTHMNCWPMESKDDREMVIRNSYQTPYLKTQEAYRPQADFSPSVTHSSSTTSAVMITEEQDSRVSSTCSPVSPSFLDTLLASISTTQEKSEPDSNCTYNSGPSGYTEKLPSAMDELHYLHNPNSEERNLTTAISGRRGIPKDISEPTVCRWANCYLNCLDSKSLVMHIEQVHIAPYTTGKEYRCYWEGCRRQQKPFNARYKLLVHMRIHNGERPSKCPYPNCTKAFSRLENLKIHIRSHTGDRPFVCQRESCNKAFSNSSDRAKHQRTHVHTKPYACQVPGCNKRYTDPSSLRKHSKTHWVADSLKPDNTQGSAHTRVISPKDPLQNSCGESKWLRHHFDTCREFAWSSESVWTPCFSSHTQLYRPAVLVQPPGNNLGCRKAKSDAFPQTNLYSEQSVQFTGATPIPQVERVYFVNLQSV